MAKIEIDHILCPMDFSEQSLHAYFAVALGRWYSAHHGVARSGDATRVRASPFHLHPHAAAVHAR